MMYSVTFRVIGEGPETNTTGLFPTAMQAIERMKDTKGPNSLFSSVLKVWDFDKQTGLYMFGNDIELDRSGNLIF